MQSRGEVLVVDDVVAIVEELVALLRLHGIGAHGAANLAEAQAALHACPQISAVACDVRLARESGLDIIPRIHADPGLRHRQFRFLFMSGDPMQAKQFPAASVHHILTKPIHPGTLMASIREMLADCSNPADV